MTKTFCRFLLFLLLAPQLANTANLQDKNKKDTLQISLSQAMDMAVKESEDVKVRINEMEKTDYIYKQAFSSLYPHFSGEINYHWYPAVQKIKVDLGIEGVPAEKVPLQEDFDLGIGVRMEQILYTFGKVGSAIKAADNGRTASRHAKESKEREASYDAILAYLTVLLSRESLDIAKSSFENASKNKSLLEERFRYGRIPKNESIKARADVAARVPTLKESEINYETAKRNLKMLLNLDDMTEVELTDRLIQDFPDYELKTALDEMLKEEPTLKQLQRNIELNRNIAALQKAEYYPSITGFAEYNYFGQSEKAYIGSSNLQHLGTLGIKINIPIWNGGETNSIYKQALLDKSNAELALKKTLKNFTTELKNAVSEYDALKDTYKANVEAQRLSEESFKASQDKFSGGDMNLTDLNDAELRLTLARLRSVLNLYDINKAIARIEKLMSGEGERSWISRVERRSVRKS